MTAVEPATFDEVNAGGVAAIEFEWQWTPVITLRDQQRLSFGAVDEPALDLRPTVLDGLRAIPVELSGPSGPLGLTTSHGGTLLLRHGGPGRRRWTLVTLTAISLRPEDARRYEVPVD